MSMASEIERFVVEEIALGIGVESIDRDEDLLANGIVDSLGIMELVTFLEGRYGISVGDDDLVPENFQTVNGVVAFVERKQD
jgi:acyl carrier protein